MGRAPELEALDRLLERVGSGRGGAMLMAGEAGIGKSRLLAELEARAQAAGVLVLVGNCVELAEGELAFAPIVSALRGVMEDEEAIEGLGGPLRSALGALWPVPGGVEGVVAGREQLFEAVYRVLAHVAERRPVLLIVEDVHWIDRSSRDLLAFLVRSTRRDAIALVVTYRPDELDRGHPLRPFLVELERSGQATRVELEGLTRSEVAEQLAAIAGLAPEGRMVERIFSRSEGNPFFAEELLATAQSADGPLPSSLRETLLLRVERLSPRARAVVEAAAVAGRSVDHRLLARVVGESGLHDALREAIDHHVLVRGADALTCAFRHALLREAIHDDVLPGQRLRLHRAFAEALARNPEYAGVSPAAELAHHWLEAGELPAALTASVNAASEAGAMHAYGEAFGHVDRALGLWDRVRSPQEAAGCDRAGLLLRASELADWAGEAVGAVGLAEEARLELDEDVDPLRAALAEQRIGHAMHQAGRAVDSIEHYLAARRLVPEDPPTVDYALALYGEGRAMMLSGRMPEARERLEEALQMGERLGAGALQAQSLSQLAIVYAERGEHERAIAAGRDCLRIANETASAEQINRAYLNGSQGIDDAGCLAEALAMGMEGIAAAERLGMSRRVGDQLRIQAAWRLQRIGRLADAERVLWPALENATTPFNVAGAQLLAGRLAVERGELDQAGRLLEPAWGQVQRSGGFQLIGTTISALVLLEIRRGELERARERAREGLRVVGGADWNLIYTAELYWLAVRVEAELAARGRLFGGSEAIGEYEQTAVGVVEELASLVSQIPGDGAPPEAVAFLALAEAELTRLRGLRDPEPWQTAAGRFRAIGALYPAAYADLRAAEALALAGARPAETAVPLKAAHARALEIGARPFLEEVVALARRAGVSLDSDEGESAPGAVAGLGLTEREVEVLRLLAEGRTNRQIGDELFITAKTASVHVSRIFVKLGVANRAEAAAAAHRMGLARPLAVE